MIINKKRSGLAHFLKKLSIHQIGHVRDEPDCAVLRPLSDAVTQEVAVAQVNAAVRKARWIGAHALKAEAFNACLN